jgi:hypothetical protein
MEPECDGAVAPMFRLDADLQLLLHAGLAAGPEPMKNGNIAAAAAV